MTIRLSIACSIALAACGDQSQLTSDGGMDDDGGDATPSFVCGAGTVEQNGTCVPITPTTRHFEIRISELELGANGHTRRRIVAFGTEPDGSPIVERVIIGVDRATAGTLDETILTLGTFGATTFFTPCLSSEPDCLGAASLTLALASASNQVIAQTAISLVPETGVSTIAPCIDHPEMLYLDGNDFIRSTMFETGEGAWTVSNMFSNSFSIGLVAADENLGGMNLVFESIGLAVPLDPGVFLDARRATSQTPGHPGLEVTGGGHGCNVLGGSFQIHTYTRDTQTSDLEMVVSFEQHCEFDTRLTEGCLRYKP
jgi:hypothetical protein